MGWGAILETKRSPYLIQKGRCIVVQAYELLQLAFRTIHQSRQNNSDDFHEKVPSHPVASVPSISLTDIIYKS